MSKSISSYLSILCIALLLALIAIFFLAPPWAAMAVRVALIISSAIAIFSAVQKQIQLFREKPTGLVKLVLNVLLEIMGILLAMVLAGLLGRYIVQLGTAQISNNLTKMVAGIVISLLAGIGVGILVTRTWGRLVKTSAES
jgi:hypothetical protein